jgi:hypothetical protein
MSASSTSATSNRSNNRDTAITDHGTPKPAAGITGEEGSRCRSEPGLRPDLNVIDNNHLGAHRHKEGHGLHDGERRPLQRACRYRYSFVASVETLRVEWHTGPMPERSLRKKTA